MPMTVNGGGQGAHARSLPHDQFKKKGASGTRGSSSRKRRSTRRGGR